MEQEVTPLYSAYSDDQLREKISIMQQRIVLLESQVEDARGYQTEMIGLLMLRGTEVTIDLQ